MANRYYTFTEGEFYHLYNRGNSKQDIFRNPSDYDRFFALLYIANNSERFAIRDFEDQDIFTIERNSPLVHIGAYCLMSNHFHLLLTPAVENGVSNFMLKLATGYSSFFNKKYLRSGKLFEGSYQAKHADSDEYLKYLFAYIHLNPFRGGKDQNGNYVVRNYNFHEYRYSSLPDYLGEERRESSILSKDKFPRYFDNMKEIEGDLSEWLDYEEI